MLHKGPLLEATPPYAPAASIRELIADGVLSADFTDLESVALPLDRPLYAHQDTAIRKASAGRNVVVATGTGSGKTESFLVPILDSLMRERAAGHLGPGVRALLLYPMNALANDQVRRLRALLADYPSITFGRYTGDTEHEPGKARDLFSALNPGEPMVPNELLSRREMQESPPHLLLTNYAMLEYMLLRPQDLDLFEGRYGGTWRFLVVDEAHVYDGTQGAEVAMLLRRLRDRVVPDRELQCIATSATVGGEGDPGPVVEFATRLFGVPFEWVNGDLTRQDLVVATRVPSPSGPFWGPLSAPDYLRLRDAENRAAGVLEVARAHGYQGDDPASALAHEASLASLRQLLVAGPQTFASLVPRVFPAGDAGARGLEALVDVASSIRYLDDTAPLSARYHLFIRATEGAFSCLSDSGPHVHLARREHCNGCDARVFEIGSCKRCGAVHLVGHLARVGTEHFFRPRRAAETPTWLALGSEPIVVDEDDVAVEETGAEPSGDDAYLCAGCGVLREQATTSCSSAGCSSSRMWQVRRLKQRGADVAGCVVCGARGTNMVRMLDTGADASGAVVATSLYQRLLPGDIGAGADLPGEGRKLLMFSDSRQAAAYFAPYLSDSYERVQRRRLIMQGLLAASEREGLAVEDLVFHTRKQADSAGVFERRMSAQQQSREVARWVMSEVLSTDDRQSLEGLGLLRIGLLRDPRWTTPQPLLDLGLSANDAWGLLEELLRSLRQQGAVSMPDNVPPNDEIFLPRLGPIYARQSGPEAIRKVLSWLPARGTNRRVDYLRRVLARLGSDVDVTALLTGIWRYLSEPSSPLDWLKSTTRTGVGTVLQVDHELLRIVPAGKEVPTYRCSLCRRMAPLSVLTVCPAIGCTGELELLDASANEAKNNHYRTLYLNMNPVPLVSREHTAQWRNVEAARVQHEFIRGEVNALSCSTTFELGVDVGELQSVMMRNMPPTTANYVQRAGRAGRRTDSAALVVTFAQRRSHDLTRYDKPEAMIAGVMRAPYVPLDNPRIDRRHAHSVALAAFFRWLFETEGTIARRAGEFFMPTDGGTRPLFTLVADFLDPVPLDVLASLHRVLPPPVQTELDLDGGAWVGYLTDLLDRIAAEVAADVDQLKERVDEAVAARKFRLAERYERVVNTIISRELLGFLASRNVLPKYGFPVDSVELRTQYTDEEHGLGAKLELSRDLSQAIYEYAPGSQVVAGGGLWTSAGVYRLPGKELQSATYLVCARCGQYRESAGDLDPQCPTCGDVPVSPARTHVVPEFGFVAAHTVGRPGSTPPKRSWAGATYVLRLSDETRDRTVTLPGGTVRTQVGPRGRLVALAEGRNRMGFWLCDWCGWGTHRADSQTTPRKHPHLLKNTDCTGRLSLVSLAHRYETDLLRLDVDAMPVGLGEGPWLSLLYAILEGASERFEIARDDIDGALMPSGPAGQALVLFDTVPGGAGNVIRLESRLEEALEAALLRVRNCECGPETSCYGCLRSFGNQRVHDDLSRGQAAEILVALLGGMRPALRGREPIHGLPAAWQKLHDQALSDAERALVVALSQSAVTVPVQGYETEDGVPLDLAWPEQRVAVSSAAVELPPNWTSLDLESTDLVSQIKLALARPADA